MKPPDARLARMAIVFQALADPTRLRIIGLLAAGEICVCHIHDSLGVPQPTASRHLAYLRRAGLVRARRDGLWVHYSLAPQRDLVIQALVDAAAHGVGHLATTARDRRRLGGRATAIPLTPAASCCPE